MIAIGVLGIGLIMVAAIFPVALTQHRESIEKSRSLDMLNKAEALLRSRINASNLWVDSFTPAGMDSAWFMLPMSNLAVGSNGNNAWDWMSPITTPIFSTPSPIGPGLTAADYLTYANCLNFCRDFAGNIGNPFSLTAVPSLEQLSDRKGPITPTTNQNSWSPLTDAEFQSIENRFAWVGFYRRMAGGTTRYAVAVNRILRDEAYAEQDVTTVGATGFGLSPQAVDPFTVRARRLPVPWRVTVGYDPVSRRLFNSPNPEGLGELAPPGSRIMVGGHVWRNGTATATSPTIPIAPAGRILTVTSVFDTTPGGVENPNFVDILEDPAGLPTFDFNDQPDEQFYFDVILFPPPAVQRQSDNSVQFGRKSPLIQWKVNL